MFTNNINPTILSFNLITIHWYGLFLATGILLSIWILLKLAQKNNLSKNYFCLFILVIIGGSNWSAIRIYIFIKLNIS